MILVKLSLYKMTLSEQESNKVELLWLLWLRLWNDLVVDGLLAFFCQLHFLLWFLLLLHTVQIKPQRLPVLPSGESHQILHILLLPLNLLLLPARVHFSPPSGPDVFYSSMTYSLLSSNQRAPPSRPPIHSQSGRNWLDTLMTTGVWREPTAWSRRAGRP